MDIRIPTLITILSLLFVGCSDTGAEPDEPQSREEAEQENADQGEEQGQVQQLEALTTGRGAYRLHTVDGADIKFDLPTDPSHELLVDLEEFRQDLDAPPATYVVADIDNRQGTLEINIPQLNVYDTEGNEYEFKALGHTLLEWEPEYDDSDHYWTAYDQILEFQDELDNSASVAERNDTVLLYHGDDLPDEFTRVAIQPYGMGVLEDAYPADAMPSDESSSDDYLGYLSEEQRNTATSQQLDSYNECMTMVAADFEATGMEFDGSDAHYNCISAIEGTYQHPDPALEEVDWDHVREVNECIDELFEQFPQMREELPQDEILEDPTIVYEHPLSQAHCL